MEKKKKVQSTKCKVQSAKCKVQSPPESPQSLQSLQSLYPRSVLQFRISSPWHTPKTPIVSLPSANYTLPLSTTTPAITSTTISPLDPCPSDPKSQNAPPPSCIQNIPLPKDTGLSLADLRSCRKNPFHHLPKEHDQSHSAWFQSTP